MHVAGKGWGRRGAGLLLALAALSLQVACDVVGGVADNGGRAVDEKAAANAVANPSTLPSGLDPEEVERGRELFLPCAVCHGLDGRGNQLGPSLRDAQWIRIDGSLASIEQLILAGVPEPEQYPVPMVPMGGGAFDAAELRAVASYVYAISHPTR